MIFSDDSSFSKQSVRRPFFFLVGLAVVRRPADTFHMELIRASVRVFVRKSIFTIVCTIVSAIACTIARAIFLVGPGFKPLVLHTIFFVGPGFDSLTLQHDLFLGPGFDSQTKSLVSSP